MFIAAQFIDKKILKADYVPINNWMKKMYLCIMEYYLARKDKFEPFVQKCMHLENIMLTEISETHKFKYHMMCSEGKLDFYFLIQPQFLFPSSS